MDKIGEAIKPMEACVADMMQDERKRKDKKQKDEERKDKVAYKPRDVGAIDTGAFIKSDMKFGLDRVFRLADAVLPGKLVSPFACPVLLGDTVELFTSERLADLHALFYPEDIMPESMIAIYALHHYI